MNSGSIHSLFVGGGLGLEDIFRDRRVQALVSSFLSGHLHVIRPVFDLKYGFRYPDVEKIIGESPSGCEEFLARLCEAEILNRELYDTIIYCPKCLSPNVSIHYSCPYCKSFKIKRESLIEHVKCGYMDVEEKFLNGGKLVCPKCNGKMLKPDVDYRKAGVWCTCKECGKSFDLPEPRHFCRECHHVFAFDEAVFKEAYAYNLNEEATKQVALDWTVLSPIKSFMEEIGFKAESPGFLNGRSGVKHMFDIVAQARGAEKNTVVINASVSTAEEPVPDRHIIEMFAKVYDSAVEKAFFIAIPKMSGNGRKLADLYGIKLIEAKKPDEALEKLKAYLP